MDAAYMQSMEDKLKAIVASGQDDLVSVGKTMTGIRGVIGELKDYIVSNRFADDVEEIRFFKHVKPIFLSQYYFHKKKFDVTLFDAHRDEKSRIENNYKVLRKLERFSRKNQTFFEYCLSGSTDLDYHYFSRSNNSRVSVGKDDKFSTRCDSKLSKLLATELTRDFIRRRMVKSENGTSDPHRTLEWTSPKIALIETIYALYAGGVFNHGKAELKQIVEVFEKTLGVELGNYARSFSEIKIRKSGSANFIEFLRDRLLTLVDS